MNKNKYLFRFAGAMIGFTMTLLSLDLLEKPESEVEYKNNDLKAKIWYCDEANNYLKKVGSNYFLSAVDLKRDSLIEEKNELEKTLEYKEWQEEESKRKKKTDGLFGLGLLGGFLGGYYFDKKRLRRK